jgi:dUTP pyrophosphatase
LIKVKKDVPTESLKFPGKYFQLILRPLIHFDVMEVDELSDTTRGDGGFGSTGS